MADAMKCDRCKKYYDEYKVNLKVIDCDGYHIYPINRIKVGNRFNTYCGYDVCPECMKEFFKFIRIPDEMFDFGGDDK